MAFFATTDYSIVLNSVDLSTHCRGVELTIEAADLDTTAMGASYHARIGGLKDWNAKIEFNQNFAAATVDATVAPIVGTVVTLTVKPTSSAVSATNPSYAGSVLVKGYAPLSGSVGDLAVTSVDCTGAGTLTRATS